MSDSVTLLALFEDIDPAANAIEKLHDLGVGDDDMNIISGVPIPGRVLGRPGAITYVSRIALTGAILGMLFGLSLIYGIPFLYPLHVGGQAVYPVPIGWIITFEMTMLGLMVFALFCLFASGGFPSYTPKYYVPEISNGKIAILLKCDGSNKKKFVDLVTKLGRTPVKPART